MSELAKGMIPKSWNKEVIDYLKGDDVDTSEIKILRTNLSKTVESLVLSKRALHAIWAHRILYVGQLVQLSASDLLKTPNFGPKSLNEITEVLSQMGVGFGMSVPSWPLPIREEEPLWTKIRRDDLKKQYAPILEKWVNECFMKDESDIRKYTITTPSEYEMKLFLSAKEFKIALDDIREHIRNQLKYAELDEATYKAYEGIQAKVFEILDETSYFKLSDDA